MIIKKACKFCNKTTDITSEIDLGSSGKLLVFQCGHSYIEEPLQATKVESSGLTLLERLELTEYCETHQRNCNKTLESHTGKHLFPYQAKGIAAAIKNNGNFIFADEMGLGKTIQGLGTIALNRAEMLPAIFICKSIAKTNWLHETLDLLQVPAQVIYGSNETPFDDFKVHIISHDMVNRLDKMFEFSTMRDVFQCNKCKKEFWSDEGWSEDSKCDSKYEKECNKCEITHMHVYPCDGTLELKAPEFKHTKNLSRKGQQEKNKLAWWEIIKKCKTLIIDESHLIKNPESQRSKAIKKLASFIPHRIGMSGTLIKNNATEYFTILNIVKPEKFWRYSSFCQNYVRYELVKSAIGYSQKFTGLIDPEAFKKMTSEYMIRRTTDEVMPELPKLFKQQKYVELDKEFKEIYDKSEAEFADWFDHASTIELRTNLLAQLAILRHQTSLAKIDFTISLVEEFLLSNTRKLAIFTHHIDSREILISRLDQFFKECGMPPVFVLGMGSGVQNEIEEFRTSEQRVIVLSTLSHGESINLQFCADSILHERQWNPANEDQAISGRFRRIGQEAEHINCYIPVAIGTIDEYYVDNIERKRKISKEIDEGMQQSWNDSFVSELAEQIAQRGRAKWKL